MNTKISYFLLLLCFNLSFSQAPLHSFTFDGNYCNTAVTTCFFQPPGNFFRADRFAAPFTFNALEVVTGVSSIAGGAMANIPVGTNPRSISIWVKFVTPLNSNSNYHIFGYGGSAVNQGFNLTQEYSSASAAFPQQIVVSSHNNVSSPRITATAVVQLNTWYHYVVTFSGTFVKIYRNGQKLQDNSISGWSTTFVNSGTLRIGENTNGNAGGPMHIDDLQIYDYVLDDTAVSNLYQFNNSVLSTKGLDQTNINVELYPSPVRDLLNIEMANALKSLEIYNLQGQKVKTSTLKRTNVSDLAAGMYLIRVEDTNNAVKTMKIVKQ